jgi:hypothetical protein
MEQCSGGEGMACCGEARLWIGKVFISDVADSTDQIL